MSYIINSLNIPVAPTQKLNERQVLNSAGGFSFGLDNWQKLRRWLILGSENGSYYVSEKNLTVKNASALMECISEDGLRVVDTIVNIAVLNQSSKTEVILFSLMMCMNANDVNVRQSACQAIPVVCNTMSKLQQLASLIEESEDIGWGRAKRNGFAMYFNALSDRDLSYQVAKYQSRNGWSVADILRKVHPSPTTNTRGNIYKWIVDGILPDNAFLFDSRENPYWTIAGMEKLKLQFATDIKNINKMITTIREYNLPEECIPTELKSNREIQLVLLEHMPYTHLIRNLGNLTRLGVIDTNNADEVAEKIVNGAASEKVRVHPIALLSALRIYSSGHGFRGTNSWDANSKIVDALDNGYYESFRSLKKSDKKFLVSIDSSGSMQGGKLSGMEHLTVHEGAVAMAMATLAVSPKSSVTTYDTSIRPADISVRRRLDDILFDMRKLRGGGTNNSLPFEYAIQHNIMVDCFVCYTDNENWAGDRHPTVALAEYRRKINPLARAVNVAMVGNYYTDLDTVQDNLVLECSGFDTSVPDIISMFADGEF